MGLILASGSPRRRTLLQLSGIPIAAVVPADIDESRRPGEDPITYARRLAVEKAAARPHDSAWTLAADTIVHIDSTLFGKPETPEQAAAFLTQLSGRWHEVTTAWCLQRGGQRFHEHTTTRVRFRDLDPVTIDNYVATGESADKAGGYGIQGLGSVLIAELHGSYTNVVGLPLVPVLAALQSVGITPTAGGSLA
ncbi:MAG: septum formation protein [Myxococcota bacterium]|jgi:septum formation protein